jgi:biopolymer transport protein ExbB
MAILEFFQAGGGFMWPILAVMAVGLAICVERWFFLQKTSRSVYLLWNKISPMLKANDLGRAHQVVSDSKSPLASVLSYGFSRLKPGVKRESLDAAFEEGVMEIIPRLEDRTHYLATLANAATLLGLLGTIIGLIDAFSAVAAANPAEKANMLSSSISVAMNTTAFGLIVAIPLLLLHSYLSTKTTKLVDSIEMIAVKSANILANE